MKVISCCLLVLSFLTVSLISTGEAQATGLRIQDQAPNLIGFDALSGDRVNLYRVMTEMRFKRDEQGSLLVGEDGKYSSEFIHYVTVLNFFSRSCIPCLREIPTLNQLAADFQGKLVKFRYINVDPETDEEAMRRLIERYQIKIPVMMTNQAEAIRQYDAAVLPHLVIVDPHRRVAHIQTGFHDDLADQLTAVLERLLDQ